jgi:aminoglycoside/choline kinase family phosphotransferase
MMLDNLRALTLLDWLENDLLLTIGSLQPASSDASFRRYFRVKAAEGQFIVMDAPPDKENIGPFIQVAGLLAQSGVNVPVIFQQNRTDGFLLLEDFGAQCFLDKLNTDTATALYQSAFNTLFKLQTQTTIATCGLPRYDGPLLQRELAIFEGWFINGLLDDPLPLPLWEAVCGLLVNSALEQPVTCVHRDYHSRNLMVLSEDSPGVIDFQDAVIGPVTYDLVSLLRDCYITWPDEQVGQWMTGYYGRLLQAGLISCDEAQFKRWFDLMGMQRHLKAIGIFSRLHLRDGKSGYLNDIPRTLNYVIQVCGNYPELAEFGDFLRHQLVLAHAFLAALPLPSGSEEVPITP